MTSLNRRFKAVEDAVAVALKLAEGELTGTVDRGAGPLPVAASVQDLGDGRVRLVDGERAIVATVRRHGDVTYVAVGGRTYEVREAAEDGAEGADDLARTAESPMTGTLVKVAVVVGDVVEPGQELFVVEAMKMEYVVRAPREGRIARIHGAAGGSVDLGATVVEFAEDEEA